MLAGLRSDVKCRDNNLLQNLNSLLESFPEGNGDDGDRTRNLRLAKPALSQLSYIPSGRTWIRTTDLSFIRAAL